MGIRNTSTTHGMLKYRGLNIVCAWFTGSFVCVNWFPISVYLVDEHELCLHWRTVWSYIGCCIVCSWKVLVNVSLACARTVNVECHERCMDNSILTWKELEIHSVYPCHSKILGSYIWRWTVLQATLDSREYLKLTQPPLPQSSIYAFGIWMFSRRRGAAHKL